MDPESCVEIVPLPNEMEVGITDSTPGDCDEVGLTCYIYDGSWIHDGTIPYC